MNAPTTIDLGELELDQVEPIAGGLMLGRRGHVAVVLLDKPDRGNAFDAAMIEALASLWQRLGADRTVRAIVVGSTGTRFFCTGRDVTEMEGLELPGPRATYDHDFSLTSRRAGIWIPVVCAVEGAAVGAGLHFVIDADIVVAGEAATFRDTHVNIGLVAGVEVVGLAHKIGLGNALYLTLVGKGASLDAARALTHGLVQEVVTPGTATTRAIELAELIAENSPAAVSRTAQAGWEAAALAGRDHALRHAWQLIQRQMEHPDSLEGPLAWVERRPPSWTL